MHTAVSAPGKVFLAGGYLVLDRAYTALVFGLSARIHVVVEDIDTSSGVTLQEIVVRSPQFRDAEWIYGYHQAPDDGGITVTQLQGASNSPLSRNPFVETALTYALTYITSHTSTTSVQPIRITILADNDYYSQPSSASSTPESSTTFTDFNVRLTDAHKTGLGSSAALVTAFTGALLSHYLSAPLSTSPGKAILHNLAQAAHCAAQGKVGSGFDIATAVYGTCIYRRFTPAILEAVGEAGSPSFKSKLKACVEDSPKVWDTEVEKGKAVVPKGMALVMCDVDCGSSTPGMVKKVLAWKAGNADAKQLWDSLQTRNENLAKKMANGTEAELSSAINEIRKGIREMSNKSGVPIEPVEQTELLDALSALNGVIGGVVPGAGGYDAVVLLVRDDEETISGVAEFLKKWSAEKKSNVKLLGVKGEMEGVREEGQDRYGGWLK